MRIISANPSSSKSQADDSRSGGNSSGASAIAAVAGGATGHVALCITDELWTLSGVDAGEFSSDLTLSLAKVLASLPLPEDDQVGREGPVPGVECWSACVSASCRVLPCLFVCFFVREAANDT